MYYTVSMNGIADLALCVVIRPSPTYAVRKSDILRILGTCNKPVEAMA
jgi:hypothetical protein